MKFSPLFPGTLSCVLSATTLLAENSIMPEELIEVAQRNKCSQISDFYKNKPGSVNPVYVYGYVPGDEEDSAVFWCKNQTPGQKRYALVFLFRKTENELTKCPDRIEWANSPRGLSILKDQSEILKGFVYLKDRSRKAPDDVRMTHNAIRSYYDGVEEVFYCHNGEWLVRQRH